MINAHLVTSTNTFTQQENPCSRCGRERIITRTWEETFETFSGVITEIHTDAVCPDPECQAIIDKELSAQREKRDKQKQEREIRLQNVKINNKRNSKSKTE